MKDILLTTINAKWIHPSLALRLLKANLGGLDDRCEIIEFALRQPFAEKTDVLAARRPKIIGISVSIWNHTATLELLRSLIPAPRPLTPVIIMGGPEVSHLPQDAEIFKHTDYVIKGEGEIAFRQLCEKLLAGEAPSQKFIEAEAVDVTKIKTAYHLYTDEDVKRKLIYVESSRGCPFNCEFCLNSVPLCLCVKNFSLNRFFSEMNILINRGVKTFKFLDRTFNSNVKRTIQICEFFLEKLKEREFTVHFEMVPTLITPELIETLSRFPPNTLRLEIGIQSLNPEVAKRIGLPGRAGKTAEEILEPLRILREKTNAIIHADLIAGLPGEDLESFAKGFDLLWDACGKGGRHHFEIQLGILKLLPGAPIARFNNEFKMRYNQEPPYEVMETSTMSGEEISRLKNFARFWEVIINRLTTSRANSQAGGLININELKGKQNESIFYKFMELSDALYAHFGKNWGIDKEDLLQQIDIFNNLR